MMHRGGSHAGIAYELHGQGGEPVLLIAGLGGMGSFWQPNLPAFSERHRVLLHDHRGTGGSERSLATCSVAQMTVDVLSLMDHLGIERAHIVGHSTGGAIGQVLAIDQPHRVASLVLYASWTRADPFMRRIMAARQVLARAGGMPAYLNLSPVFLYPDWWVNANEHLLLEREAVALGNAPDTEIAVRRIDAVLAFDRSQHLESIVTPTLVVCAQDDLLTPARFSKELACRIPNARLSVVDTGGHALSEVVPAVFNALVLDFIASHPIEAGATRR